MLKFLRKYQKWMLVVFCGALMVAFLIPQAVSQFAPNPAKQVFATVYDGQTITRDQVGRASADLEMLRRLVPGMTLIPPTGSDRDDALAWIMVQRAAERNGLGASENEAYNLMLVLLGMQDFDSLEERAKQLNVNARYLIEIGRQYLVAEQYRQLVAGTEYNLPATEDEVKSPGIRRVIARLEANQLIQQIAQNPQQLQQQALIQGMTPDQLLTQMLIGSGYLDRIQGHERFSTAELRYALQRQFAEIDLTVVVLDAEDRIATTVVDDAYVQEIFERFADDEPGTGQPYGVGYLEPDKVKLEALRVPIDVAREVVAKQVTPEDVRTFYNENQASFIDFDTPAEGETPSEPKPAKLTADLRDEIRLILTEQRAEELVRTIAQEARLKLNEQVRGLEDDGIYKVLPGDFVPMPLVQLAAELEAEHGVALEPIVVDDFVSSEEIIETSRFTQAWLSQMPTAQVKKANPQFGFLLDVPVPQTVLGGKAGLFTGYVPTLSPANQRPTLLANYLVAAKPFLDDEQLEQVSVPLQVGLPGEPLRDATGSAYVFRIKEARPARPAQELALIDEQVREDATKIKAYVDMIDGQDALLSRAAEQSIERLMPDADAKTTLTGLTRGTVSQPFFTAVEGVRSTGPILQRAFQITDDLLASGGFEQAKEADRLFAVELPGDYKLALVRIDSFRPMTRKQFETEAAKPSASQLVSGLDAAAGPTEPALSFEALQRYTNFKWDEDFEPDEDEDDADGENADA